MHAQAHRQTDGADSKDFVEKQSRIMRPRSVKIDRIIIINRITIIRDPYMCIHFIYSLSESLQGASHLGAPPPR